MVKSQRVAQGLLVLLGVLTIIFSSSVYADNSDSAFPADAKGLIASAGATLGVLVVVLAIAGLNSGERWAWLALWTVPAFMAAHAVLFDTWIPDGVFAVLSAGALVLTRPRYGEEPQAASA